MSRREPPSWITEFKRRTSIIDIIAKAYEDNCNCEVCTQLRNIGNELGELFMPPQAGIQRRR